MSGEGPRETAETEQSSEVRIARRDGGVLRSILRGFFWPFSIVVRAYRGLHCVLFGRSSPQERVLPSPAVSSPARPNLTGRKRLRRLTRLMLCVLPRWAQAALGYPVSTSIGRSLSPEISVSPTKPYGKGSKRKQDELDDEDEEDQPTWVEVLTQDLADEGPEEDPDYEPSSVETESEEYASKNDTESDLEVPGRGIVIEDVTTGTEVSAPAEASSHAV